MTDLTSLEKGDLVELDFDTVNGMASSHKGQVLEVDSDPGGEGVQTFVRLTDKPDNNTEIFVYGGEHEGEKACDVFRHSEFRKDCHIGENATVTVLG